MNGKLIKFFSQVNPSKLPWSKYEIDVVVESTGIFRDREGASQHLHAGAKKVLISAHGNSLRALVKYLDDIPDDEIVKLNIPTGIPLIYELDDELRPIKHYYLGNPEDIKKMMKAVADEGKAK